MKELDRDKIMDGDILEIEVMEKGENNIEPSVWFTLSHSANGLDIELTKSELEWLLSEMEGL